MYFELFETIFEAAPDPVHGVGDFFAGAAAVLRETDYADACPVATVALEVASRNEPLRHATADVFDRWITGVTARLGHAGIGDDEARRLAILVISLLEGAFILCRARRGTDTLDVAGAAATAAVRSAMPEDH